MLHIVLSIVHCILEYNFIAGSISVASIHSTSVMSAIPEVLAWFYLLILYSALFIIENKKHSDRDRDLETSYK